MARDWIRLPSYSSKDEAEKCAPDGWQALQIEQLYEQLPVGKRFEQKTSLPVGRVPVIDQSAAGIVGWHNEAPGVSASSKSPVVTFANHTCEMRLMERPFSVIQNVFPLVGRDNVCRTKFFYYLTKGRVWLEEYKGHFPDFRRKWILCPPYRDQERLTKVLGDLDKKISLNLSSNQTLEAMAQAIFQSWFVDFEPVKAKIAARAEGRDPLRAAMSVISGKADAELDTLPPEQYEQLAATAALFPDEMEESELGEIPKGWASSSVADVAEFGGGKVDVSALSKDIYISTENMLENRGGVSRAASIPSVATVPSFRIGQILVSNIRPYFKKIWMARFDGGRSPDVLALEPIVPQSTEFLYNLMYQDAFFEFMTRTAKGAKMPRGDKDAIMGWKFPCPDEALMVCFSEKVRPYYEYINSLKSENDSLAELRDTLLPKLLSGELQVPHAEAEAVA